VPSPFTSTAIALGVGVTVVLGILPQWALDLADKAGVFVR
jgi:NADH-quinone oxidoreductase subunit N